MGKNSGGLHPNCSLFIWEHITSATFTPFVHATLVFQGIQKCCGPSFSLKTCIQVWNWDIWKRWLAPWLGLINYCVSFPDPACTYHMTLYPKKTDHISKRPALRFLFTAACAWPVHLNEWWMVMFQSFSPFAGTPGDDSGHWVSTLVFLNPSNTHFIWSLSTTISPFIPSMPCSSHRTRPSSCPPKISQVFHELL